MDPGQVAGRGRGIGREDVLLGRQQHAPDRRGPRLPVGRLRDHRQAGHPRGEIADDGSGAGRVLDASEGEGTAGDEEAAEADHRRGASA